MPEYHVHILNWPIPADSPEEAARIAARAMKEEPTGFFICVTEEEIKEEGDRFDSGEFEETPIGEATVY